LSTNFVCRTEEREKGGGGGGDSNIANKNPLFLVSSGGEIKNKQTAWKKGKEKKGVKKKKEGREDLGFWRACQSHPRPLL